MYLNNHALKWFTGAGWVELKRFPHCAPWLKSRARSLVYNILLRAQELKLDDILNMCAEYERQIEEEQRLALSIRYDKTINGRLVW